MPFLDAKALETDPDGMAFLRPVIRRDFEQEEAAVPRLVGKGPQPFEAPSRGEAKAPRSPVRSEAVAAVSLG